MSVALKQRIKGVPHLWDRGCHTLRGELPQSHYTAYLRDDEVESKGYLPVARRVSTLNHFHKIWIFRNRKHRVCPLLCAPYLEGFSVPGSNQLPLRVAELIFLFADKFGIIRREYDLDNIRLFAICLVEKARIFSVCEPIVGAHRKSPIGFLSAPYMPYYWVWQSFLPIVVLYSSAHIA